MLVSGLWKLAAMTGVIGVGLVAVYQAQKGMDQPVVAVAGDSTTPENAGDPPDGIEPAANSEQVETAANPQQEPNPFGDPAQGLSGLTGKPNELPDSQPSLAAPSEEVQDGFGDVETTSRPKTVAPKLPTDGLDFRGDPADPINTDSKFADSNPTAAAETSPAAAAEPARLPDDLDALEAQVKAAVEKSKLAPKSAGTPTAIQPFVRQVKAVAEQPAGESPEAEVKEDPFGNLEASESPAAPKSPAATEQPAAADPFDIESASPVEPLPAGSTVEVPESEPTVEPKEVPADEPNPFEDFPLKRKSAPATPLQDSEPNPESLAPVKPLPASDPFDQSATASQSAPVSEPTLGPPADLSPATLPPSSVPNDIIPVRQPKRPVVEPARPVAEPDVPSINPKRAVPKLPTEVPDAFDSGFPAEPPSRTDSPTLPARTNPPPLVEPERSSLPDRAFPDGDPIPSRRSEPQPLPNDNDLSGNGTVTSTDPRGVQQARLTIEKIAPQQATLGEPLVYSVIVKNIGSADARQVVVEDRVPKGTDMVGSNPPGYLIEKKIPDSDQVEKKLSWPLGTLKPNEQKKISIKVIPRQEGPVGSVARVHFATEVAAEIQVAGPKLSFTAKAPPQARVGETIEMVFLLKNTGTAPATNVSVRDLVPAGLKHEAATDIECPIGKLAPNETREIVLAVTAVKPGRATNKAILTGDGGINQQIDTPIDVVGEQLALTRSGQTKVYVDRPTQFTNSIRNEGDTEVKHVRISEVVPAGMEFVGATNGGQYDQVQRAIFWDLGALPPGAEAKVSSKLIAKESGIQQGQVVATGPNGSKASITTDIDAVGRPELQVEAISRADIIAVGDRLTSKIQLKNHGSAPARNVRLSIRLPRELKLINVRGVRGSQQDGLVTFEAVPSIDPNGTVAYELEMEAVSVAQTQMTLEISADHLSRPARRSETVEIAAEIRQ
ncbi:MAG: DUF11 domain-containing protein [Planctomycetes bacterium]|nr:DUF11 domain-containing protein [Planctomycetota bacterium]